MVVTDSLSSSQMTRKRRERSRASGEQVRARTDQRNDDGESTLLDELVDDWKVVDETVRVEHDEARNDFNFDQSRCVQNVLDGNAERCGPGVR